MKPDNLVGNGKLISLLLPKNLVQRLNKQVHSEEKLNKFITDAIEQRLSFEEQFSALEETAASWLSSSTDSHEILAEDETVNWLNENGRFWNQAEQ